MSVDQALIGGRYRLEGLIGRGGMASVWRATDTILQRAVAVKRLHARFHDDPELAARFRREGTAVARLSHPNLVRLLDQGRDDDEPYLVFELVEGWDLKTIIRRDGRLEPSAAASVCSQVARALAAAHAAGVIHRDIKSHNVLVTHDGVAKLADFGIARIVEGGSGLTRTGIVMGSSDYLAPEQAEGREVDGRADIYSLGVVLFEALTGLLPFRGEHAVAVATKHVYEAPPDPRALAPGIAADLASTCLRALRKSPAERFSTAAAFADALDGREATGPTVVQDAATALIRLPKAAPRVPRRHRLRRSLVAVGAVAVAGTAGVVAWQGGLPDPRGEASGAPVALTAADYDPYGLFSFRENPDEVQLVNDGDTATAWHTELYRTADLGDLKPGVGLRLTLAKPTRVTALRIWSTTPGGVLKVLGPGDDGPGGRAVLAETSLVNGRRDVSLNTSEPVSELLLWFVELPPSLSENGYRAAIGEVEALGVAKT